MGRIGIRGPCRGNAPIAMPKKCWTAHCQRPVSGVPPDPKINVRSAVPVVLAFFKNHLDVVGLKKPTVSAPSPSQSPTIGAHPELAGPKANVASATPVVFEFLRKKRLREGSNKPTVSAPAPFQWPTIGCHPRLPGP